MTRMTNPTWEPCTGVHSLLLAAPEKENQP